MSLLQGFMRIVHCLLLLSLLLVQYVQPQTSAHKISCPDGPSRKACDLFNEAIEDGTKEITRASRRDRVVVCFRPNSNSFLLISYDSPLENLWQAKDGGEVQQSGNVDFLRFTNGNPNSGMESLFAVGQWFSKSPGDQHAIHFEGISLPPPGVGRRRNVDFEKGSIAIDSSRISVSKSYFGDTLDGFHLSKTEYEFSLTTSTNEFAETSRPTGATPISGTGHCVNYK